MKYSYNWLKKLSGTKKTPEQLTELLTMRAFEVEGVEKIGGDLKNVVVGKILEIQKHPNADKLQIVRVGVGSVKIPLFPPFAKGEVQVVCGAWNIKVGDKVPVALIGAKLPNGIEIREAEIRGMKSQGMLCAEDELGLGKDHNGILILDATTTIGKEIARELNSEDALMDIKILPDRAHDALSHLGMAREICALEGKSLKYEFAKLPTKKGSTLNRKRLNIIIDKKLCSRYIGALVENVEIKESPVWIKSVLRKFGINPVNQIVDATNFVMLEMGQPMHAFDLDKLAKKNGQVTIEARNARDGEEIKLLDGNTYKLTLEDIVIADGEKAIALAGVMGGADTAITGETKNIVLESANFDATSIRKTRVRLNIISDASIRFEKMIDPNLAELGMSRVLEILKNFSGKITGLNDARAAKINPWKITLDAKYVVRLLGEPIAVKKITDILKSLGLRIMKYELRTGKITIEIPTFRMDLITQEDLIEEIGRIYGYEKIKSTAPQAALQPAKINEERIFEREIKNILVGIGFSEMYNYSFYSRKDAERAQLDIIKHLELQNPMNPEQELMRVSLLPNLLKNIRENLKRAGDIHIFEIGKVYWSIGEALPDERKMLVGAVVLEAKNEKRKTKNIRAEEFYEAKGFADSLLNYLGIYDQYYDDFSSGQRDEAFTNLWHRGRSAEIRIEGRIEPLGFVGEISPAILNDFDIRRRVAIFEFDLENLREVSQAEREYRAISKYPEVTRDISIVAASDIRVDEILEVMQKAGGKLMLDVDLFDIYDLDNNTSSFAFRIIFGLNDRTLKSEEIDILMKKIIAALEKNLGVKIRT